MKIISNRSLFGLMSKIREHANLFEPNLKTEEGLRKFIDNEGGDYTKYIKKGILQIPNKIIIVLACEYLKYALDWFGDDGGYIKCTDNINIAIEDNVFILKYDEIPKLIEEILFQVMNKNIFDYPDLSSIMCQKTFLKYFK